MKNLIKKYIIKKWWFPPLLFFISVLTYFLLSYFNVTFSYLFAIIGLIFLIISSIIQLFNKKWFSGILNLGLSLFTVFLIGIFVLSFIILFGPENDTFAENLELPDNVELEKPIDKDSKSELENIQSSEKEILSKNQLDFQLYNSFQPGLYEYDIWIKIDEEGTVFLKAFEITQEIRLSKSNLRERSSLRINNTKGLLQKFSSKDHFTIYEGDWGQPYAARFEIWFKPDNGSKEQKLLEKNYIIEGWMR